jgi:hypothetical protein
MTKRAWMTFGVIACGFLLGELLGQNMPAVNTPIATSGLQPVVVITTVSGLGTCNTGAQGLIKGVTDALVPVALATVAGSGAVHVAVYCNGSVWIIL